jgi:Tfp pilus assembly protein PilF
MLGLAGAMLLGVALFALRRRAGLGWFAAWAGYVMTLLPILGLVDLYYARWSPVADHWQYAALPWVLCGIVAGFARVASSAPVAGVRVVGVAVIVAMVALSFQQSKLYRDPGTFWGHVLSRDASSVLAHNELGVHLARSGSVDEARSHFEQAVGLDPSDAFAHGNLGRMREAAGDWAAAAESYRTAAELQPKLATARANLGRALASMGDLDGAIVELRRASDAEPLFVEPHWNLALVFRQRGDLDSAEARFVRVIELAPEAADARLELARTLVARRDLAGAAVRLRELLSVVPEHAEARSVLAAIEQELGRRGP